MRSHGATRVYAKRLAPNDNSKNQVYLGGDFSALNVLPHTEIYTDDTEKAGSVRDRAKANVEFSWIDENGSYSAPNTRLILYPKYPEVRMSGFLLGCDKAPAGIMRVRDEGRALILGVTDSGSVLGHAVPANSSIAGELFAGSWPTIGVFMELPRRLTSDSPKSILLAELRRIYAQDWITSKN